MWARIVGRVGMGEDPDDSVETARSHGVPGRVQISPSTYELLQSLFLCEPRGSTSRDRAMETWFLPR